MIKWITVALLILGCALAPVRANGAEADGIISAEANPTKEGLKRSIAEWLDAYCPPEKYGRKDLLKKGSIQFAIQERTLSPFIKAFIVLPEKRPVGVNGFYMDSIDCFEGAYALQKALQAKGYAARLCRGETDLWKDHFYVEVGFSGEWIRVNTAPGMPRFDFGVKKYDVLAEEKTALYFRLSRKMLSVGPHLTPMASVYISQDKEIIITASMTVKMPAECVVLCQAAIIEDGQAREAGCATISVPIEELPRLQEKINSAAGRAAFGGLSLSININKGQEQMIEAAKSAMYDIVYDMIAHIDANSLNTRVSQMLQRQRLPM